MLDIVYIILFGVLYNVLSGTKNALYYSPNHSAAITMSFVMIVQLVVGLYTFEAPKAIAYMHLAPALSILYMVWAVFRVRPIEKTGTFEQRKAAREAKTKNVHITEHFIKNTWYLILLLWGYDVITIITIVGIGNFLFRLPINYMDEDLDLLNVDQGMPYDVNHFRFLGKERVVKIPRFNNDYIMLIIAIFTVILSACNIAWWHLDLSLNINW